MLLSIYIDVWALHIACSDLSYLLLVANGSLIARITVQQGTRHLFSEETKGENPLV